jgi:argininosuccinate lyase
MSKILRGGRLGSVREDVAQFTSSIKDDARLLDAVVAINKAHVVMLTEQKILSKKDCVAILNALVQASEIQLDDSMEDVHTALEEMVLKKAGTEAGGNLHIAKSRNDQVATAIRIQLRSELLNLLRSVSHVQEHLAEVAEDNLETVILEYTHLQPAQPVTFAHYLLSFVDALERDVQRLQEGYKRVNLCPLGSGALATTSFPINRDRTAKLLGFDGLIENSIDAVSSRDFVVEIVSTLSLIAVNLSRLVEDLIIWCSPDFGVVELPDEFTGTSSIMPQKKNPEILEIIRARTSLLLGNFIVVSATVKSLPSTYNLDFQEITPKLWESLEIVRTSLDMLHKLIPRIRVNADVSVRSLKNFVAATELANILVRNHKVPFRSAHKIVGTLAKTLWEAKSTFVDATPSMLQDAAEHAQGIKISVKTEEMTSLTDPLKLVEACNVKGGPAPKEVKRALCEREKQILSTKSNISKMDKELEEAEGMLELIVNSYLSVYDIERKP